MSTDTDAVSVAGYDAPDPNDNTPPAASERETLELFGGEALVKADDEAKADIGSGGIEATRQPKSQRQPVHGRAPKAPARPPSLTRKERAAEQAARQKAEEAKADPQGLTPPPNPLSTPVDGQTDPAADELAGSVFGDDHVPQNDLIEGSEWREAGKGAPENYDLSSFTISVEDDGAESGVSDISLDEYLKDAPAREKELVDVVLEKARSQGLNQDQTQQYFEDLRELRHELEYRAVRDRIDEVKEWDERSRELGFKSKHSMRVIQRGLQEIDDPQGTFSKFINDNMLYSHPAMLQLLYTAGQLYAPGTGASQNKEVAGVSNAGRDVGQSSVRVPGYGVPGADYDPFADTGISAEQEAMQNARLFGVKV